MELIFGFIAGLLTLINPCVLPVLPIVLASALQSGRHAPLALAAGMSLAFVTLGMLLATLGHSIGLDERTLARTGAILMLVFGLILIIPALNDRFTALAGSFSSKADQQLNELDNKASGLKSHFFGGMLRGAVWSPCIGPTLGGAISMASQGQNLIWAFAIMCSFALGVSGVIVLLGYGSRSVIQKRQQKLRWIAERAKPIMGGVFIAVGLMILFSVHHYIEAWMVKVLPYWFQDLSIMF